MSNKSIESLRSYIPKDRAQTLLESETKAQQYHEWARNYGVHSKPGKFYYSVVLRERIDKIDPIWNDFERTVNSSLMSALYERKELNYENPLQFIGLQLTAQEGKRFSDSEVLDMIKEFLDLAYRDLLSHYPADEITLYDVAHATITLFFTNRQIVKDKFNLKADEIEVTAGLKAEETMTAVLTEIPIGKEPYPLNIFDTSRPDKKGVKKLTIRTSLLLPLGGFEHVEAEYVELAASHLTRMASVDKTQASKILRTLIEWEKSVGAKVRKDGVVFYK